MDVIWFTTMDGHLIGIVIKHLENPSDLTNVNRAYIGIGKGEDEQDDIKHIQETGAKFPLSEALRLIK